MDKIDELVKQMSLDEKISLLAGIDLWHTAAVQRLGIPSIKVTDGPNGARGAWGDLGPTSTLFPVGTALGATWNTELVERVGAGLASEVRAKGAHVLLAPTVNIHRTPLAGRNFECYSEDPYLTGKMAAAYIRGLQKEGISACIKHFVCNDQEFQRMSISSEVDERTLREIYLEPFRRAMMEAKPWSIMSSYNKLNGVYASENARLLKKILKEEWGFDGLVMSDWTGTYSENVPAGGLDLEMPGPGRWMSAAHVKEALAAGTLTEAELDDKACRLLRLIERVSGSSAAGPQAERADDTPAMRTLVRSTAQETIVLLKNEGGSLPLNPATVKRIAVIGELADKPNVMGGGSSRVTPHYVISPLQGIRERAGTGMAVKYAVGCATHRRTPAFDRGSLTAESGEARGLTLRIYDNLEFAGAPAFEMTTDRSNFDWWGLAVPNVNQERFSARLSGTFTAKQLGIHTFGLTSIGKSRLLLDGKVLIDNWENTSPDAEGTAGKLLAAGETIRIQVDYRWEGGDLWRFLRVGHRQPMADDPIAEAVALAREADVVIVVAGLTSDWESESHDRIDMKLPGQQDELIERVAQANPNTIVVLNAGSTVLMPWADRVPTIVEQWYNSQECGHALADVLFGDINPSGRLPTSFPRRYEDNPTFGSYPGKGGKAYYAEGLFVGYRHYEAKGIEPLFPFGYGLSYTTFEYSNLRVSHAPSGEVEASLDVQNSGTRAGKEVVQLYVHDVESTAVRPEQELKAFSKVELQPGESKTVQFRLSRDAFWQYSTAQSDWIIEPGEFEIRVGHSSRDLPLRARIGVSVESARTLQENPAMPSYAGDKS
jgi:beta-glucosidase